jgi:hypothetical protein
MTWSQIGQITDSCVCVCVCVCFILVCVAVGTNYEHFMSIEITIQDILFYMIGIGGDKRPRLDTHLLDPCPYHYYQGKGGLIKT